MDPHTPEEGLKTMMDTPHTEIPARVTSANVHSKAKTATVDLKTDDKTYSDVELEPFAFSQLLKFTDLRKKDLKDEENDVLPDAGEIVVDGLSDRELRFKRSHETKSVLAVVSSKYVSIPSEEVEQIVRETITSMGISEFEFDTVRTGSVVEMEFRFLNEDATMDVGDTLKAGLFIRNSVFGASSLRVNQYYNVLACSNGMIVRNMDSFRKVHMGDFQKLRELLVERVETAVETIWEEVEFIDNIASIEFPIEDQIDLIDSLAENRRITKKAATNVAAKIITEAEMELDWFEPEHFDLPKTYEDDQTWNTGRADVWGLLNAFTGYAEYSQMMSRSSEKDIQRVYNDLMRVESADEIESVV